MSYWSVIVAASLLGMPLAAAPPEITYWNLAPETAPAGHIVVRMAPGRTVPDGWDTQ